MINLSHLGYELHYSHNLTNPGQINSILFKADLDAIRWCVLKQPRYIGKVWKKDCPTESFWKASDVYFTFYKSRGRNTKGDRIVNFYRKVAEVKIPLGQIIAEDTLDEPLY